MALFSHEVEPHRYLYHYTSRDTALRHILPHRRLRLSVLTDTNDPREYQEWQMHVHGGDRDDPPPQEYQRISREADRLIRASTKLACFTRDDPTDMSRQLATQFGRGWAHSRMWAQYAHAHTGVCLIFEREAMEASMEPLSAIGTLWHGPVRYENQPIAEVYASTLSNQQITQRGLPTVIEQHVREHHSALYFVKNLDWASEWEYRWVLRGTHNRHEYVDISDALAGVVVGHSFPPADVLQLTAELPSYGLTAKFVARCLWRNGSPSCCPEVPDAYLPDTAI